MKPVEYLFRQMELEGIQRVAGDLIARRSPDAEDIPLVLLARTPDGQSLACYDASLPAELRCQLPRQDLESFKTDPAREIFEKSGIHTTVNHYKTYIFPEDLDIADAGDARCYSRDDPKVAAFGFHELADKVYAIEQDGMILSACVSSRQNAASAEAWVFTHPDHRRQGLARRAVTAWALDLLRDGITPFYSHNVENTNSALLARRLNLIHVFDEIVIEKAP